LIPSFPPADKFRPVLFIYSTLLKIAGVPPPISPKAVPI